MNIVRIPRLLKQTTLLLTVLGSSFLLSACGGDDNKGSTSSSSSSSAVSSHTFIPTPVTPALNGTWPNVKVTANHNKALNFGWSQAPANAAYYKLLKKADTNSPYTQVGSDFTANTISDSVSVHLANWVNSRYRVQAFDANSVQIDESPELVVNSAMLDAITYIKASNAKAGDWFGWSITMSGDGKTMAVGAPAESNLNIDDTLNNSPTSGAVYVFAKVNGNWIQEAYLKASNIEKPGDGITLPVPNPNARFGYQVALSADGNTLAVSAINEDSVSIGINCDPHNINYSSSASNSQGYVSRTLTTDIGAVYVFKRTNTQWTQQAYIKPFLGYYFNNSNITFGYSLALSGDGKTLAVGTPVDNSEALGILSFNTESTSSISTGTCINFSSLSSISSTVSSSSSSSSLSSSLSSTSNSASSSSTPGGANSGAVYIYKLKESAWVEDAYVKASDAGAEDKFGTSITLSNDGNLMAVGAPREDSKDSSANDDIITIDTFVAYFDNGGVYIFARNAEKWIQQTKLKPSYIQWRQEFGASVALSADGNTLAVGTPGDWTKTGGINPNGSAYDPKALNDYGSGATYIFTKSGTTWAQEAYLKAAIVTAGNQFGSVVSLSGNGNVLAVGSWRESSQATGINGDSLDSAATNAGAAYIFTRSGTAWAQRSYIKAPNTHSEDRFGHALSLDFTGDFLAIGANRESSVSKGINGDQANKYDKVIDAPAAASGAAYIY
jgi:hypothetical protein